MRIKSNKKKNSSLRENYIDSLRGIAILFVVIFHYTYHYSNEYLFRNNNFSFDLGKYGWSGVDIFFIVSGFCIGMTITKSMNFYEFVIRRFARLYPAYLIAGLITLCFYHFFDLPGREVDWFTGFMNLIFANFVPGLNYQYIDGIYWALIVEIKFYLFFGLVFFLLKDLKKSIYTWFLICIFGNILLIYDKKTYIFFTSIFPHANLFLLGLCIYYLKKISILSKILILIFSFLSLFINDRYQDFELYFVFLLIIVFLILYKRLNFGYKFLPYIGLISYTWYLTHNAVGIIIVRELNKLNFENISIIIATIFTFGLSIIIYNFFEISSKKIILNFYKNFYTIRNSK